MKNWSLVLVFVLVIVVLAVVVVFSPVEEGFDKVSDITGEVIASASESSVISVCEGLVEKGSQSSYCTEFQEIRFSGSSEVELVSCDDARIQNQLEEIIDCNGEEEKDFCNIIYAEAGGNERKRNEVLRTRVNIELCGEYWLGISPSS
tara:strand:- start:64 stop:507 length:444 start_codon:yes stop_codon:yes gene_type:complete